MRIVVTGGAGYIGCWLVPLLVERGHDVVVFDRLCYGEGVLEGFPESCEIVRGDIRRFQEHPDLLEGAECVIHMAGLANDPSCDLDADMTHDVNVESTLELVNQSVQKGVRRFIMVSSCAVYGHGVFDQLDEESSVNPISAYGHSKLAAEGAALAMEQEDFEPVVARVATLFGCSPRMRFDLAVNHMVAAALRLKVISIHGGGDQWRPFMHVKDGARALADLVEAESGDVRGEIFNIGADNGNTKIIDLARRVAQGFDGVELEVGREDEDRRNYRVRFGKFAERLGFEPKYSIDDGIREVQDLLQRNAFDPYNEEFYNAERLKVLLATPVDLGGEPVAPRFVPLAKPVLGPEEEGAVVQTLRSGWITSGPHIATFEKAFGATVESVHTVAVASCTDALHLCMAHLGVGPGDEVITTSLTWASVGNAILHMGATPVFADILPDTLNIDPASVREAITEKTKVIMPVHMGGHPCDLDALEIVAKERGIPIVEDAAHALGAQYKGKPIGSGSTLACFSFYAIKNITTMEGGTITLDDAEVAARLRLLASSGMSANAWDRYGRSAVPSPPEVVIPGYKCAMGNVSAAMGIEQLKKFSSFRAVRKRLAALYHGVLGEIDEVRVQALRDDVEHAWHLLIIRLDLGRLTRTRDEVAYDLRKENIGTGFHFYGLHLHRYYRERFGDQSGRLPVATKASNDVLSLPLHPGMTDKNVHEVVAALKKVIQHARKT